MHLGVNKANGRAAFDELRPLQSGVVLCHGCFDLLHLGHIRHLQEARSLGDELVVSVTADAFVNKGNGRPVFTEMERIEALLALDCVDAAFVSESHNAVDSILRVRPSVYVKGSDYEGSADWDLQKEIQAVETCGGKYVSTVSPALWSSSRIINSERFPEAVLGYLDSAKSRGFLDRILRGFAAADELKIAFIGETIIDEYCYVRPLGKPSKEIIHATTTLSTETFEGGVVAAFRHVGWRNATCVTPRSTITKRRYVEPEATRKMFECYSGTQLSVTKEDRAEIRDMIEATVVDADAVVVFDFGHGLMGKEERALVQNAEFLVVNAQTNAGNYGFNPITKYTSADYICVDDPEARLASGMEQGLIEDVIKDGLATRIDVPCITITHGRHGTTSYDRRDSWHVVNVPALALGGVDTIGAGDAFLAVAGPLLAAGLSLEEATFAGNVAGALKVNIVGHRKPVERDHLVQSITSLLK